MATYMTAEEEWRDLLEGTHPHFEQKSPFRFVPSSPRCHLCEAPFGAPGRAVFRRLGFTPWEKNPKICGRCFKGMETAAKGCPTHEEGSRIAGAEVHLSMLFADVRGSSVLARQMPTLDFTRLMNRFYETSSEVLVDEDAIIEKFVGDAVVGLFLPFLAGHDHARRAVAAAGRLLEATGHGSSDGPWCPIGVGVNTGIAFVGIVGSAEGISDFTALGDPMNITAHLASQAAIGEILVTEEAASASGLPAAGVERRSLSLKGHPVDALVLDPATASGVTMPRG